MRKERFNIGRDMSTWVADIEAGYSLLLSIPNSLMSDEKKSILEESPASNFKTFFHGDENIILRFELNGEFNSNKIAKDLKKACIFNAEERDSFLKFCTDIYSNGQNRLA